LEKGPSRNCLINSGSITNKMNATKLIGNWQRTEVVEALTWVKTEANSASMHPDGLVVVNLGSLDCMPSS